VAKNLFPAGSTSALERVSELTPMLDGARDTASRHDLRQEREAFLPLLEKVDELWGAA